MKKKTEEGVHQGKHVKNMGDPLFLEDEPLQEAGEAEEEAIEGNLKTEEGDDAEAVAPSGEGGQDAQPVKTSQEDIPPEGGAEEEPSLEEKLDQALQEKDVLEDKYLRLRADFENFKKRATKEKSNLIQYGNEALLKDLLPVIDNIERVLAFSLQEGDWKDFQKGVELVVAELHKTFSKFGLEPLESMGKNFDPNLHEAMQTLKTDQATPDTVVEELQKGYLYRDKLLRPSLVIVAVSPEETKEKPAEETAADSEKDELKEPDGEKDLIVN